MIPQPTSSSLLAWPVLYVVLRGIWGAARATVAVREGTAAGRVWAAAAADLSASVLVLGWWHPAARAAIGWWAVPLLFYTLAFDRAAVLHWLEESTGSDASFEDGWFLVYPLVALWITAGIIPPLVGALFCLHATAA